MGFWALLIGSVGLIQRLLNGLRPTALGFGHWAYGAVDIRIDGTTIKGDEQRYEGFHANAVMRADPFIKNTCLVDPVGGSAALYLLPFSLIQLSYLSEA